MVEQFKGRTPYLDLINPANTGLGFVVNSWQWAHYIIKLEPILPPP